jgi:2-polyprenyl-6-methoxyphenol hydroxylase-like FAD-dependent oxidoreductase
MENGRKRVAVVGSGITGLSAAWLLHRCSECMSIVTLAYRMQHLPMYSTGPAAFLGFSNLQGPTHARIS